MREREREIDRERETDRQTDRQRYYLRRKTNQKCRVQTNKNVFPFYLSLQALLILLKTMMFEKSI